MKICRFFLAVSLFEWDLLFANDFRIQPYRVIGTVTRVVPNECHKARSTKFINPLNYGFWTLNFRFRTFIVKSKVNTSSTSEL